MVGWPAWAFGAHFYCFNTNYMVPSPLSLIMGVKQHWVSNLNREKAKGDRSIKWVTMTWITKPSFSLWKPLHHHHLHWQHLCGVGHHTALPKSGSGDYLNEGCFKSSMQENEQSQNPLCWLQKCKKKLFALSEVATCPNTYPLQNTTPENVNLKDPRLSLPNKQTPLWRLL